MASSRREVGQQPVKATRSTINLEKSLESGHDKNKMGAGDPLVDANMLPVLALPSTTHSAAPPVRIFNPSQSTHSSTPNKRSRVQESFFSTTSAFKVSRTEGAHRTESPQFLSPIMAYTIPLTNPKYDPRRSWRSDDRVEVSKVAFQYL